MAAIYKRGLMDKITKNLQFILLSIILISTVIAVGIELKRMFLASMTIFGLLMGILINRKSKTLDILHRSAVLSIIFFVSGIVIAIIFGK